MTEDQAQLEFDAEVIESHRNLVKAVHDHLDALYAGWASAFGSVEQAEELLNKIASYFPTPTEQSVMQTRTVMEKAAGYKRPVVARPAYPEQGE